jgi:hypothetical protein
MLASRREIDIDGKSLRENGEEKRENQKERKSAAISSRVSLLL